MLYLFVLFVFYDYLVLSDILLDYPLISHFPIISINYLLIPLLIYLFISLFIYVAYLVAHSFLQCQEAGRKVAVVYRYLLGNLLRSRL
jgi:hypothetical protein